MLPITRLARGRAVIITTYVVDCEPARETAEACIYHPYHLSLDVSSVTLPSVGIPLLVTIFSTVIDI